MSPDPEHQLHALLAEEPFVRDLARQLVADDPDEVVQQTYLRALQHGGRGIAQPRSWLARVARNVASNLGRADRKRRVHQGAAATTELVPSSAALAEREERRRALVAAVDSLPTSLRTVVLLRWFEGLSPRHIAAALGVAPATVSTQLQRALEQLRRRFDAAHGGDRRAWLLALVPLAARPLPVSLPIPPAVAGPPAAAGSARELLLGAMVMTTKSKVVLAASALLLTMGATIALVFWPAHDTPRAGAPPQPAVTTAPLQATLPASSPTLEKAAPDVAQRQTVATPAPVAARGELVVHVRHGDDHAPAADIVLTLVGTIDEPRYDGWRRRTDTTGTARYEQIPPGPYLVRDNSHPSKRVEVVAGQTTTVELDLPVGLTIAGIVVDAAHIPVRGAQVEATMMARMDTFPDVVAITGADGRFEARACPQYALVGARAAGHAASTVQFVAGKDGNRAEIELVLDADGGVIEGTVVDTHGTPIGDAVVIADSGELSGIPGRDHIPPFPALTRSAADGRFRAVGVGVGTQPLRVRATGFAPWSGTCDVLAGSLAEQRIVLAPGAVIRGSVRDGSDTPIAGASIEVGEWEDLAHYRTRSAADGSFELTGLPAGDVQVRARHDEFGEATQTVVAAADAPATCALRLSRGLELHGRVVDADGHPVADVLVECMDEAVPHRWSQFVKADAEGRFVVANCPETGTLTLSVSANDFADLRRGGVDPRSPDLRLELQRRPPATAHITGLVLDPEGRPVANALMFARPQHRADGTSGSQASGNDGRFELGPLRPGAWRVVVMSRDYPAYESEFVELAPNETLNLGAISLAPGGTARVQLVGDAVEGVTFLVNDVAGTHGASVSDAAAGRRTGALATGDYHLLVAGQGIAAHVVPFSVRVGEETVVEVRLQAGVEQRVECEFPLGAEGASVTLRVLRDGALQARAYARAQAQGKPSVAVWLAPGDYALTAQAADLHGETTFTVGTTAGPPLRVHLQ